MSTDEIFDEIFSSPLVQIRVLPDLCRGWQIANPHGTLLVEIATAACASPGATILTGVRPTPINFLLALMGDSGGGKGLAMTIFRTYVPPKLASAMTPAPQPPGVPQVGGRPSPAAGVPQQAPSQFVPGSQINTIVPGERIRFETPASGEAAVTMFYDLVPDTTGPRPKDVWVRHQDPVWSDWPEIDTYVAKAGIAGSSLESNVRQGWSGQRLGDSAINRRKSGLPQTVEPNSFRWIQTIGGQYKKSASLVGRDASAGGTTQRVIFGEIEIDDSDFADTLLGREQQRLAARKRALVALGIPVPKTDDEVMAMNAPVIRVQGPGDREIAMSREVHRLFADLRDTERDPVRKHRHINLARVAAVHAGWRHARFGGSDRIELCDWRFALLVMELSHRCYLKAVETVEGVEDAEDDRRGERVARQQLTADAKKASKRHIVLMGAVERARKYAGRHPGASRGTLGNMVLNATTRTFRITAKEVVEAGAAIGALRLEAAGYVALDNAGVPVLSSTELDALGLVEQAIRESAG